MIFLEQQKFLLGEISVSAAALRGLDVGTICRAIDAHVCGEWGLLTGDDRAENELALRIGGRLLSAFEAKGGVRFYVSTSATVTTVFLADEH